MKEYLFIVILVVTATSIWSQSCKNTTAILYFVAEGEGLHDIVTFQEKTSSILR